MFTTGQKVAVSDTTVGSSLRGCVATVVRGPYKVGYLSGVYLVRGENGTEEEIHGSRLAAHDAGLVPGK